jgi:thiamine kinase-like enzyme
MKMKVRSIERLRSLEQFQFPKKMRPKLGNNLNWRTKVEEYWQWMKRVLRNFIWVKSKTKGMW